MDEETTMVFATVEVQLTELGLVCMMSLAASLYILI